MASSRRYLALDVGDKRIGVAQGDSGVRIAVPYDTIERDGKELERIAHLVISGEITHIVIGYPRNQSGEPTKQTAVVEEFAATLLDLPADIVFQDESLTSVIAEQQLQASRRPYAKADIDAVAASIILQDYMEEMA